MWSEADSGTWQKEQVNSSEDGASGCALWTPFRGSATKDTQ